ncbi:MAG: cobalamin-binding protein [Thermoproteota archaeon]|jgi:corrinoid protein of di/trimethylamine methyltransferase|uniref:Cobalamin-binding protein n=1 Tax=Candidatus Methanodesulfokora washburnensis TaxID=2478471 RepID=A0A429GG38_9CREN|nr:corrinoid protein [Candidatus Methanodesulfokores washburnensis]RSN72840.1 cobalamin-binding protein [Candidatus Methanodesulfokores washburnensis]RZN63743.1 MAG: cobalamin-binding protein [Candidatus Methanodesulfokores washburnensis]TDA40877.1 MAG: cobalamin-binding protein [Candidatus Korarchaeota archaeon]
MGKKEILEGLRDATVEGDVDKVVSFAKKAIAEGIDAYEAIMEGCAAGMNIVSEKYEKGEMFVPEILCSAEAMYAAIGVLKPYLKAERVETPKKIVLGVVRGDIHDIGKNLVKIMMEAAGFQVIDLGRDVPNEQFVEAVMREQADICGMSALMTTSMIAMPEIISELKKKAPKTITMVGGGPLSEELARAYGADGYAKDAAAAVRVAKELLIKRGGA